MIYVLKKDFTIAYTSSPESEESSESPDLSDEEAAALVVGATAAWEVAEVETKEVTTASALGAEFGVNGEHFS
jgi:hypothetical protein